MLQNGNLSNIYNIVSLIFALSSFDIIWVPCFILSRVASKILSSSMALTLEKPIFSTNLCDWLRYVVSPGIRCLNTMMQ